jgi:hypothetical protein
MLSRLEIKMIENVVTSLVLITAIVKLLEALIKLRESTKKDEKSKGKSEDQ